MLNEIRYVFTDAVPWATEYPLVNQAWNSLEYTGSAAKSRALGESLPRPRSPAVLSAVVPASAIIAGRIRVVLFAGGTCLLRRRMVRRQVLEVAATLAAQHHTRVGGGH
eukprot:gnl/TRDRNA2_/TRDRNA2_85265_c0_seq1.p1 gnl/TRDRNA2_/TRDRNA2_85265_c0~~gnl/TRDRNA2_/TRDRNA2_85265_c0_seq1.p1  ORF type:complete len:109 (-),score=2.62 gnl/TRDRNA2_/TRDRNA2_85265_c0_seq1:157-483(-)